MPPPPGDPTAEPSSIFDELMGLVTPERLLLDPRATGAGVRVCLLDSGVEQAVLEERCHQRGQVLHPIEGGVFVSENPHPLPYTGRQSTPHGTTVADILLSIAPGAQLFAADIFGPRGSCEVDVLIRALRWAVDVWHCKIVNLSLGVPEQRLQAGQRRQQLLRAVEEAYFKDVLIFAAAHNDHPLTRSYPAAFAPSLLSVDKRLFEHPLSFAYELRDSIEFLAHGRGYLGPFANEPATSWAAPHLAGIAARLLSLRPGLKPFEVKTLLYWMFQARRRRENRDR
jgi:subtilisin